MLWMIPAFYLRLLFASVTYLKPKTIQKYNKRYYAAARNRRGLGFDKPQINPKEKVALGIGSVNVWIFSSILHMYRRYVISINKHAHVLFQTYKWIELNGV